MRSWATLIALATLAGCNSPRSPSDTSLEGSITPTGNVSGQLFSVAFAPLPGATVTLAVPGRTLADGGTLQTTTNENGEFVFENIPAVADALVSMHLDGYADQVATVRLNATAGKVPLSNANAVVGPYTLSRLTGTLKVRLYTSRGFPAKGAKAQLDVIPTAGFARPPLSTSFRYGSPIGRMVFVQTADDTGLVTFNNIPDPHDIRLIWDSFVNYIVSVPAFDESGDGVPDHGGAALLLTAGELVANPTPRLIEMPDARSTTPFEVVMSNVNSLRPSAAPGNTLGRPSENMVKPGEPITVVFGKALASASVRVTNETGKTLISTTQAMLGGNTILNITPTGSLAVGQEYNIAIHAVSQDTGEVLDTVGYFFVGDPRVGSTPAFQGVNFVDGIVDGQLSAGEEVNFYISEPLGWYGFFFTGPQIAFFNHDLDGSGTIGDSTGELGNSVGFEVRPNEYISEPGTAFTLEGSEYTTRWRIFYNGALPVPVNTQVTIAFDRLTSTSAGIQTIWGQPMLRKAFSTNLSVAP